MDDPTRHSATGCDRFAGRVPAGLEQPVVLKKDGVSKAEALRRAQLEMINHPVYHHPAYWAAFAVYGNQQKL